LKTKNIEIYLYGSCARGENIGDSDIDLLIIGKIKRKDIVDDIERFSKKLGKDINFKIFSDIEWAMMLKKDKAYYNRVEKDKIRLI
jgi:predicted nucleotidyltransferase